MKFNLDSGTLGWLAFSATEGSGFRQMDMSVQSPALGGAVTDTHRASDTPGLTQRTVTVSEGGMQASWTLLANGTFVLQIGFTQYNLWHAGNQLSIGTSQGSARSALGLGSAATVNTGTSGGTLGLLNSASTYSAIQTSTVNSSWAWNTGTVAGYVGPTSAPANGAALGTSSNHPLYLFTNGAVRATIDASAAAFAVPVTAPNLPVSGTWTPTLTGVANVGTSGAAPWYYQRVGNYVTFAGQLAIDPTTASVATRIGISLPIASAMTSQTDAAGTGVALGLAGVCGSVYADAANDRLTLEFLTADAANRQWHVTGMYRVI